MKTTTILLSFSAIFLGGASAAPPPHPHIHLARRQMINETDSAANATITSLPNELSTSLVMASTFTPSTSSLSAGTTPTVTSKAPSSASAIKPSSPPTSTPTSPAGKSITVKAGDTLEELAQANGVGICDIAKANNIANPNVILEGQTLNIPAPMGEKDNASCL